MPADQRSPVRLETLATIAAGSRQRLAAMIVCALATMAAAAVLPIAQTALRLPPALLTIHQTLLVIAYGLTAHLLFAQFRRARSFPLLLLGAGCVYAAGITAAQFLSFPDRFGPGAVIGEGLITSTWLWVFWHIGPPVFALAYAAALAAAADGRSTQVPVAYATQATWIAGVSALLLVGVAALTASRLVEILPSVRNADGHLPLVTSGIGPTVGVLIQAALAAVWLATQRGRRSVLDIWLCVALFLLFLDVVMSLSSLTTGTVGWTAGRVAGLCSALIMLAVYLREADLLYGRAEGMAMALSQSELRYRTLFDSAPDNLLLLVVEGEESRVRIVDANPAAEDAFGVSRERVSRVRPTPAQLFDAAAAAAVERLTRDALAATAARAAVAATGRSGAVRQYELVAARLPHLMDGQVAVLASARDVTEARRLEDRLRQTHKMEALGQLTSGIAHDFNNLLTVVVGNLDLIVRASGDAARVERLGRSALRAANRGEALTQQLLVFSRRDMQRPETIDINTVLADLEERVRRAVGETIEVQFRLGAEPYPARIDASRFEIALINLAINGREAMPRGGRLVVEATSVTLRKQDVADHPECQPGLYTRITVADNGPGMDSETIARAFEPFFTTKEAGSSSGLGLSQVYGFCRQAGGFARIDSAPGRGTRVILHLPRSGETIPSRPAEPTVVMPAIAAGTHVTGEVVLVVEDDEGVLGVAVETLQELGYTVVIARNGPEALTHLRNAGERLDILFSDVVMPGGVTGVELAIAARRLRPGLRILLTSGYASDAIAASGQRLPDDIPILGKPYRREDLAARLRDLPAARGNLTVVKG